MVPAERKQPQQARAQQTVHAILEATVQILDREGFEAATTTRIAEVAGVSIGSLYQYFSHRDAVLNALQDREFEQTLSLMQRVLAEGNLHVAPRQTVNAVLKGLADLYMRSPGLHRVLAIDGLRVAKAERVYAFDVRVIDLIRHFLSATRAPIVRSNIEAVAFILYQSVRATMLAHLLERPHGLDADRLIEELTELIMAYLFGPDAYLVAEPRPRRKRTNRVGRRATRPA